MNETNFAAQLLDELPADFAGGESDFGNEREIHRLRDLRMVLVGGGSDGVAVW